jgi:hypothetical protein
MRDLTPVSQDKNYFSQVDILFGAVTWPHEQDIAPETLVADGGCLMMGEEKGLIGACNNARPDPSFSQKTGHEACGYYLVRIV